MSSQKETRISNLKKALKKALVIDEKRSQAR